MIWWAIPVALILLGIILKVLDSYSDGYIGCYVIGAIALFATGLATALCTNDVMSYQSQITQCQRDRTVYTERANSLCKVIENYTGKYPLEKELYKNIDGIKFLLEMPQIKSDNFLTSQLNEVLKVQNSIYEVRIKENSVKAELDRRKNRWFVPTLVSAEYDTTLP